MVNNCKSQNRRAIVWLLLIMIIATGVLILVQRRVYNDVEEIWSESTLLTERNDSIQQLLEAQSNDSQ